MSVLSVIKLYVIRNRTAGWKTLMAWTAALPFCLSPNTRSIHWQSVWETWSDSRACLWMRMKSRGSFLAQGGRFTWFTRSLFCRTPKSKPARGESGKYHANIRREKLFLIIWFDKNALHEYSLVISWRSRLRKGYFLFWLWHFLRMLEEENQV